MDGEEAVMISAQSGGPGRFSAMRVCGFGFVRRVLNEDGDWVLDG